MVLLAAQVGSSVIGPRYTSLGASTASPKRDGLARSEPSPRVPSASRMPTRQLETLDSRVGGVGGQQSCLRASATRSVGSVVIAE